jgi:3,4-dihydroxy 2-butanone 4-phosphate synthase/GTP cyclohydrolase II
MNHILDIDALSSTTPERESIIRDISRRIKNFQNINRPFITISYAQSLNGFIAKTKKKPIKLSGKESLILTHQIRGIHDSILIGIGTILADDPQLNIRLVKGRNPRPIILDTNLKFPLKSKLLKNSSLLPWIVTGENVDKAKISTLEDRGAKILQIRLKDGKIDLSALLPYLAKLSIGSIMIEGGAEVISSFVKEKLVDLIITTLTPHFISSGLPVLSQNIFNGKKMSLKNFKYVQIGQDLIAYGMPSWKATR